MGTLVNIGGFWIDNDTLISRPSAAPSIGAPAVGLASRSDLGATATPAADQQVTVAALNSTLPVNYGKARARALLANVLALSGNWVFWVIWGRGPTGSYTYTMNDLAPPAGVTATHYTGAAGQVVDPTLVAAFAAIGVGLPTFAEALPGVSHSVIVAPPSTLSGPPQFNAVADLGWKLCYDPRLDSTNGGAGSHRLADPTTWAPTRNPALILADYLMSTVYGASATPDWPSVIETANANDGTVGVGTAAELRRLGDLVVDREASVKQWVETLRTMAACWLVPTGDTVKLVPDIARSSVRSYGHTTGTKILQVSGESMGKPRELPTVVEVVYMDASQMPWRDISAPLAKRPGVDSGAVPWRQSTVRMPWITRATQANREAIERLNKLWLRYPTLQLGVMDEGMEQEIGDPIDLTYPDSGYDALPLLVLNQQPTADGWALRCAKDDPNCYSDVVESGPAIPNTPLPLPTVPTPPSGLTLSEERFTTQDKTVRTRIRATWTAPADYPFELQYRLRVWDSTTQVHTGTTPDLTYATPAMAEATTYLVELTSYTSLGESVTVSGTIAVLGKDLPPPDVATFNVSQFGAWVLFNWARVVDVDAIKRYEIRRWPLSGAWSTGTVVDAVDALATRSNAEPPGFWYYGIVAIDSTERPSTTPKVVGFTVAADSTAYFIGEYTYTTPTLSNMLAYARRDGVTRYVTAFGDTWGTLFPLAMSNYPAPVDSYHAAGTSGLTTEWWDVGAQVSGDWVATVDYVDDDGVADVFIDLSPDLIAITPNAGASAKGAARYARVRIETTGAVTVNGLPRIVLTANPQTESFAGTSSAAGPVTVTLRGHYFEVKSLRVDVSGTTALVGMWANVVLSPTLANTFDVEVLDNTNTRVATAFLGEFKGISY